MLKRTIALLFLASLALADPPKVPRPDLAKDPTLYVVGYAHLDTQWRWELPTTISQYLANTLRDNFVLFEKYPRYVFNFSGANRYRMMKEYYPADYARLQQYVAAGRWFPSGSSMEESDVNSPSAESIIRQVLYGSEYFRRELGRSSAEYMLPDCFGFPSSLPTILAHCGIRGFSTQKLTWGSAAPVGGEGSVENTPAGTPFNVGIWEGPDGSSVIAAFNPGSYSADIKDDLTTSETWLARVRRNGEVSGLFTDYHYYGTGDIGGAPSEPSVARVDEMAGRSDAPLRVISSTAEQMFLDIDPRKATLPRYRGELELTEHSAGSLTSQAYHKRWNRANELLADAAERASVAAAWLGGPVYPQERLNDAWALVATGQFHDDQAGTSTPKAYEYTWNTDVLAMNQFAQVAVSATVSIASALDTSGEGHALVVYNPLQIAREDVVEANDTVLPPGETAGIRVIGPDGAEVPSQKSGSKILFLAKVPPLSWSVFRVVARSDAAAETKSALAVTTSSLDNGRYRIRIDGNGDIASIVDASLDRELLASPIRLAFQTHRPHDWPAWNMDWADQQKPPRGYVTGPAEIRVVESGPVRAAVEVRRKGEGSAFVTTIRLAAGDAGNRIEIEESIDWRSQAAALKAVVPLTASSPVATYNWQVGTIERGNNEPKRYEVATHEWIDLTDAGGSHGVTLLTGGKYGSDKPDDRTLRLTLVYTPGIGEGWTYPDQATQDWGLHEITWGLAAHGADRRAAATDWHAARLEQPLVPFWTSNHEGTLGRTFSLLRLDGDRVRVMAVKKAEHGDEVIVRLVELDGKPAPVRVSFAAPLVAAREVDGQELPRGAATIEEGALVTTLAPYQIRSFAIRLAGPPAALTPPRWQLVLLPYDLHAASTDGAKSASGFDVAGRALPAEMLPRAIPYGGIRFWLPREDGANAVAARGQTVALPEGPFRRAYVLAASADGDRRGTFKAGDRAFDLAIQDWGGFVGQWDNRTWVDREEILPPRAEAPPGAPLRRRTSREVAAITPGFVKPAPVAWYASHRHTPHGANEPYAFAYLFAAQLPLPAGATSITLPDDPAIRVLAITVSDESGWIEPARPLYDTLAGGDRLQQPIPAVAKASGPSPAAVPRVKPPRVPLEITVDRNRGSAATGAFRFERIPSPAVDDAAAGAKLSFVAERLDTDSAPLAALVDGRLPVGQDEPASNVFFKPNSWGGRIVMDLGRAIPIDRINTYSWHWGDRGPQVYKVYGARGRERRFEAEPASTIDPAARGWTLIGFVDTRGLEGGDGGQYAVSLAAKDGSLGSYRYLLFDVFETESNDAWGQTFYSEIDVVPVSRSSSKAP